jgi:hypothetical protein
VLADLPSAAGTSSTGKSGIWYGAKQVFDIRSPDEICLFLGHAHAIKPLGNINHLQPGELYMNIGM